MNAVSALASARAQGDVGAQIALSCTYCHGESGDNQSDFYPRLAGLPAAYITAQLNAYRGGGRSAPPMRSLALALTEKEIDQVSAFFATQPVALANVFPSDPAVVARGRDKAAMCVACHGPGPLMDASTPPLAGQGHVYLLAQMQAYRTGERRDKNPIMPPLVAGLTDADLDAIAHYYASL